MIPVTEPTIKLCNKKIQDGAATIKSAPRNKKHKKMVKKFYYKI